MKPFFKGMHFSSSSDEHPTTVKSDYSLHRSVGMNHRAREK